MASRRSAWLWALAGLAGFAAAVFLRLWVPGSGPETSFCFSRRVLGLPCPGCGMTRAFAYLAKGQWSAALAAHPLAPVLAIEIVLIWLAWGRAALRNSSLTPPAWLTPVMLGHVAVLCALWLGRLATGSLPW